MTCGLDQALSALEYAQEDRVGSYWSLRASCKDLDRLLRRTHGGPRCLNLSEGAKIARAPLFELRDALRSALRQGRKAIKDRQNEEDHDGADAE
jgi:hypothetical protein